jgi:trigger factor
LTVVRNEVAVEQSDIDARLEKMREDFAELVVKEDGVVAQGDTAVIDFEGFKDGVAFDGGKGENHPLVIGSNSFIPGFEDQVVNMAVNEEKEISVTFPEDYGAANLAGAPVVFKVKVNEVKVRQVPELNDDFAKDINAPGVETFDELVEKLRMDIYAEKEKSASDAYDNDLLGKVVEAASVEIPAVMIEEETEAMFEDFKRRLEQQGFNIDMYSQITGQTQEFLKQQIGRDAEGKVKVRLVLSAIAKKEGLNATDEEINQEFASIAAAYNMEVDQVKQYIQPQQISYDLRLKKAFDFIKESANN